LVERLEQLRPFTVTKVDGDLRQFAEEKGIKTRDLFMPVRLMVTGKKATPPLFDTMAVLGRERCRSRMRAAIQIYERNLSF